MKNIASSLRLIRISVYIELIVLLHAWSKKCCHGLLQASPFEYHCSGARHKRGKNQIPILCLSKYKHSINEKSLLEKAGGISYRQSVCTSKEMDSMREEISIVMKRQLTKERSSIAQNRIGATLIRDETNEIFRILEEGSIYKLVQRMANSSYGNGIIRKIKLADGLPVEVRVYETAGASMAWHRDDIMFDPPQLEVVFTLENNSDCATMWKVKANNANKNLSKDNEDIHSQETEPNSMLLLLAGGPDHCVTSLKRGRRVILKCAYVYSGAAYVGEENYSQFGKAKGKSNTKRSTKAKWRKRNPKR